MYYVLHNATTLSQLSPPTTGPGWTSHDHQAGPVMITRLGTVPEVVPIVIINSNQAVSQFSQLQAIKQSVNSASVTRLNSSASTRLHITSAHRITSHHITSAHHTEILNHASGKNDLTSTAQHSMSVRHASRTRTFGASWWSIPRLPVHEKPAPPPHTNRCARQHRAHTHKQNGGGGAKSGWQKRQPAAAHDRKQITHTS